MLQYLVIKRDENMKSAWSSSDEKATASATKGDGDESDREDQIEDDKSDSSVSSKGKEDESRPSKQKKGRKNRESSTTLQAKWDEMFNRLLQFRRKHGHCLVPNRYSEDPQLGSWVSTQRRQYKILTSGGSESTPMTPERASRLMSIGFEWATKDPRHVPWETRYGELLRFVEKYGHAQVPIGWEENAQLSNWVSTQRQEYKLMRKGRSSRLTNDRIKLLNNIGFVWEAQRGGPRRRRSSNNSGGSSEDMSATDEGNMAQNAAAAAAAALASSSSAAAPESPSQRRQLEQQLQQQNHSQSGVLGGLSRIPGVEMQQRAAPPIHQAYALENLLAAQQQQDQLARLAAVGGIGHQLSALELHAITSGRLAQLRQQAQTESALRLLASQGVSAQQLLPTSVTEAALAGLAGGQASLSGVGGFAGSLAGSSRPYNLDLMAQLQQQSNLLLQGGIDIGGSSDLSGTGQMGYAAAAAAAAAARQQLSDLAGLSGSSFGGELRDRLEQESSNKRRRMAEASADRQQEIRNVLLRDSEFLRDSSVSTGGVSDALRAYPGNQGTNMGLLGLLGSESSRQGLNSPLSGGLPGTSSLDQSRFQRLAPGRKTTTTTEGNKKSGTAGTPRKPGVGKPTDR